MAGFSRTAKEYERGRPSYPPEAVRELMRALGLAAGARVLDLAAGTGKLTRLLLEAGLDVVAVEPLAAMRAELVAALPDVEALDGTAEAIPLAGATVEAVLVAQAFHWFDPPCALAEIHRVLRPGGALGLIWNSWDDSGGWLARVSAPLEALRKGTPQFQDGAWRRGVEASPLFGRLDEQVFRHTQETDREAFAGRIASISSVGALPAAARALFLAELVALVPDDTPLLVPYRTHAYSTRRCDDPSNRCDPHRRRLGR